MSCASKAAIPWSLEEVEKRWISYSNKGLGLKLFQELLLLQELQQNLVFHLPIEVSPPVSDF